MSEPPVSGCWASSRSNRRGHPGERVTRGVTVIGHPAKAVGRASIRPTCGPGWSAGSPCTSRTDLDQDTPHNCGRSACRRVTTRTRTTGPTTLPASPRPATTNSHSLSRPLGGRFGCHGAGAPLSRPCGTARLAPRSAQTPDHALTGAPPLRFSFVCAARLLELSQLLPLGGRVGDPGASPGRRWSPSS